MNSFESRKELERKQSSDCSNYLEFFEAFWSEDDFDHIQDLVEHVCRSQTGDSRSANLAKVNAEILVINFAFLETMHSWLCWDS